ncbi:MAG: helix-turn-helix domain-containing protein [Flavobacteriaceae bacterium]|nr:helix-turn-helix domain-containing protein [Flavobacteriaceae bacterium]
MVNETEFAARLQHIIRSHSLSASAFADRIGVQRSGISHLLSGRNKPSLDFVLKVVKAFPEVDLYWLLKGKGSYPSNTNPTESRPLKTAKPSISHQKQITRVMLFYDDGSFESWDRS